MKSYDLEHTLRAIIARKCRQYMQDGHKMNALATKSGLSPTTVSRLVYGETKWPRFHTVAALCWAMKVRVHVVDEDAPSQADQEAEVVKLYR